MQLAYRLPRMKKLHLAFSLFLISCGVESDETDSPVDINPAAVVTVSINFNAPPALVMVREGVNGPWRAAFQRSATSYETNVRRPYTVMGVCDDGFTSAVNLDSRTPQDDPNLTFTCISQFVPPPHRVLGTMVQPGGVTLNGSRRSSTVGNWQFDFRVPSGTFDLIAASASTAPRVAIRRGLAIAGNTTLPPVDVAQEGTAMVDTTFTLTNPMHGETVRASVFLITPNCDPQAQIYGGAPANAKVAPSSLLLPGEKQEVSIRSEQLTAAGTSMHSIRRQYAVGDSTSFTFWAPLKSFTFPTSASPTATWRWRDTKGVMDINLFEESGSETNVSFSRHYLMATGLTSFSFHFDAPGFLPQWQPDLTSGHSRSLFLQDIDSHVKTRTIQETIEGPAVAAVSSGLEAARARAASRMQQRQR
jgi:hypothetical protein